MTATETMPAALTGEAAENLAACDACRHRTRSWPGGIEAQACKLRLGAGTLADRAEGGDCPMGYFPAQKRAAVQAAVDAARLTVRGRTPPPPAPAAPPPNPYALLWAELHRWGLSNPTPEEGPAWLAAFASRLTCSKCRGHWDRWTAANPCPFGAAAARWTFDLHNSVNRKLNRAEWDEGRARRFWDIAAVFAAVFVINLPQDKARLDRLIRELDARGWPFARPVVLDAVDGVATRHPEGAIGGCRLSHQQALGAALDAGARSVLVLEDDATLRPDFAVKAAEFLSRVPDDWDAIWFGHQNSWWVSGGDGIPEAVAPGVVRSRHPHRLHAVAYRGNAIRAAFEKLKASTGHADHALGELGRRFKVYAPDPPLIGQAAGWSRLMNRNEGLRFWESRPRTAPAPATKTRKPMRLAVMCLNLFGDRLRPNARDSQKAAAERWGATYFEVLGPLSDAGDALAEKLLLDRYGASFEKVVYLDRDVVIGEDCPNLLDVVPGGAFGAALDDNVANNRNPDGRRQMADACRRVGLPADTPYFNSGLLVFEPAAHAPAFEKARELAKILPRSWPFFDQGLLSVALAATGTPTHLLPRECNPCGHAFWNDVRGGRTDLYPVMHFCGSGERDRDFQIDRARWRGRKGQRA